MLRPYQNDMLSRLIVAWERHRSVMVQMPTGTGKTWLMAEIVRRCEGNVLIVAHRRELIEQIGVTLASFGLTGERIRVESVQKLAASGTDFVPELVIVDEAHHAVAKTYRQLWDWWKEARFVGLTATPCRMGGEALTDLFDVLLQSADIQWFIDHGWLSDFEYVSAKPDSLVMHHIGGLKKRGADGDFQTKEMAAVLDVPESVAHLYDSYWAYARGKKGIVYAIDRAHAAHIAAYYSEHGVAACVIDAKTSAQERARLVEAYREDRIDVIVNVDIFSEGFDCPEVAFIQLARPTLSLTKYLQQVGRGMRVSQGKNCVLILDQVGLYQLHGLPTDDRNWRGMFIGQQRGRGLMDEERPVIVHDEDLRDSQDKQLVNLEMVHIKRRGEKHEGMEVFVLSGMYGVMMDGKVTCPAQFEHIERLDGKYTATATYPYMVSRGKTTVIDENGRDLRASLYGKVECEGDFFKASNLEGQTQYWDAVGGRYYRQKPEVERMGRFDVVKQDDMYMLRQPSMKLNFRFRKEDVLVGRDLTIIRDMVIVKRDLNAVYKIYGYWNNTLYVENRSAFGKRYQLMEVNGRLFATQDEIPRGVSRQPDLQRLGLTRVI